MDVDGDVAHVEPAVGTTVAAAAGDVSGHVKGHVKGKGNQNHPHN